MKEELVKEDEEACPEGPVGKKPGEGRQGRQYCRGDVECPTVVE